ncbi:hypothetical protein C8J57DRAFT_1703807 [Mycena rebaudengoi]|nr:hypothetical protein C8J57DRAFT_1703807 [Mycena rebaudengoi]
MGCSPRARRRPTPSRPCISRPATPTASGSSPRPAHHRACRSASRCANSAYWRRGGVTTIMTTTSAAPQRLITCFPG